MSRSHLLYPGCRVFGRLSAWMLFVLVSISLLSEFVSPPCFAAWRAGLSAGSLASSWDTATPNPCTTNTMGPETGKTQGRPPWADNITWVYTGQMYLNGGKYCFAENIDDDAWLILDGVRYLNDWNSAVITRSGVISKPAGWYNVEIRFGNGAGNCGPVVINGWTTSKGFGYNTNGLNTGDGNDYIYPEDDGSRTLFRYDDGVLYVTNSQASLVLTNSAVLGGVACDSSHTNYVSLYYGMQDGGMEASAWSNSVYIGCFTNVLTNLSYSATGLINSSTYYYRFRATNSIGDGWAPSSTVFTTRFDPLAYGCKMKITFSGYSRSETLTNFPALVIFKTGIPDFSYSSFTSAEGADLRFTASDGTTLLSHEIEKWNQAGDSFVWVQVPALAGAGSCVWAYWNCRGCTVAPSYTTNGTAWDSRFKGVWHMQGTKDSTLNQNTGNVRGGVVLGVDGQIDGAGKYYYLDGDDYLEPTNSVSLENVQEDDYSISAVFRPDSQPPDQGYTNDNYAVLIKTGFHMGIRYFRDKTFSFEHWLTGDSQRVASSSNKSFEVGSFYHVQAVCSRTNGSMSLYVNGLLEGSLGFTAGTATREYGTSPWRIGIANLNNSAWSWPAHGIIDEVRIESGVRSADWVWACWMNQLNNNTFCTYSAVGGLFINNSSGASAITTNSAILNGQLIATGNVPAEVWVYWGLVDAGTNAGGWATTNYFGTNTLSCPVSFSTNVAVALDKCYYYRYCAKDAGSTVWAVPASSFISGQVIIQATDSNAFELGLDPGVFTVFRPAGSTNEALTVNYTIGGTATAGSDYQALAGSVVIPAGATNAIINVLPIDDGLRNEGAETVILTLVPGKYAIGSSSNATVNIFDDDTQEPGRHAMKITFAGYNKPETLTNFPLLVALNNSITNFSYDSFISTVGYDLRILDASKKNLLNYEIDEWNTNGTSYLWVQVPALSSSNDYIWAFWGQRENTNQPVCCTNGSTWAGDYGGVWHLSESAGSNMDSTANHNNGIRVGNTRWSSGFIAGAQYFDGNSYINLGVPGYSSALNITNSLTVSSWLYHNTGLGWTFAYSAANATSWNCDYGITSANQWGLEFGTTLGGLTYSSAISDTQQWCHVSFVYNYSAQKAYLYVNGSLQTNGTLSGAIRPSDRFTIGSKYDYGLKWTGYIDEMEVSSSARSSNWIWACWLSQASNSVFNNYGSVEEVPDKGTLLRVK